MIFDVRHRTDYSYSQLVSISHHLLHLEPRDTPHQRIERFELSIEPSPGFDDRDVDTFGNPTRTITLDQNHDELVIEARSRVRLAEREVPPPLDTPAWEEAAAVRLAATDDDALEASRYAFASPFVDLGDAVEAYARECFLPGRPILDAALELNGRIFREFTFDNKATSLATPVAEVLETRRGVCQDFSHLMLACLRSLGLPARYQSGYIMTRPPEGQERLVGADASHAWVALWVPRHGWVELDPTNDCLPMREHVTLAWGRDYGDVSPISGIVYGGGAHDLTVAVDVVPLVPA
ncbi:MAG: transglutaminase family protein [Geminicoccaceae bacterium]|jgi:transglutaminase-like putative cysteine protease|nr:transglutaminase family protein [Geminicoccaceae bacterium]HRY25877.1 transglutaminase family protein [Geminicoccaceae bacterium]